MEKLLLYIVFLFAIYFLTVFISVGIYFSVCYEKNTYLKSNFCKLVFYPGMNLIWSGYYLFIKTKKSLKNIKNFDLFEPFKHLK